MRTPPTELPRTGIALDLLLIAVVLIAIGALGTWMRGARDLW